MLAFGTQLVRVQRLSHTYLCGVRRTCHLRLYVWVEMKMRFDNKREALRAPGGGLAPEGPH